MAETEIAKQDCDGDSQSVEIISSGDSGDFPSRAVKDLLSHGGFIDSHNNACDSETVFDNLCFECGFNGRRFVLVCGWCVLRLFGHRGDLYSYSTLSSSTLSSVFGDLTYSEENITCSDKVYCSLCLGILQFSYCDDKGSVVSMGSACEFTASVADLIKKEGHRIDEFSLEMSIPSVIQENELFVCSYMKKKYASDPWFQSKELPQCVSVKDALKSSMTGHLEKMVDCKSTTSSLCIRLTYSHPQASTTVKTVVEKNQECKRRKTVVVSVNGLESDGGTAKCDDFSTREFGLVVESSSETHQDSQLFDQLKFPLEKVSKPCKFVFQCNRTNIYFGGRYLKFSRNVSQTRWIIDDERMGDASVEELIGSIILPVCRGDNYKFHAAGREDIDVRMLGSGRPFLIEVQNARHAPTEEGVKDIEKRINDSENKLIGIKNLKIVGSQGWTMMREGESEKQKQYAAVVWISRPLEDEDFQSISSYKEMCVLQKTPIRVLHRRSPLEREKIIHWMRMEKIVGSSQYFLLHLCTQAGTYIKEFVHGDLGRTHPSIGSILGCRAEILQLDVTDVKMDCFLDQEQGT